MTTTQLKPHGPGPEAGERTILASLPKCGAKNRGGGRCGRIARPNGRCRFHGGLSTGPKTAEGRDRIRKARTIHGRYSTAAMEERAQVGRLLTQCRAHLGHILETI